MKFSANLGFLWSELPLTDAIHAAKVAGFDAVECHWPYDTPAEDVAQALTDTGLNMLGLNTIRGDLSKGENGLNALPNRMTEARAAIDQAIEYARITSTENIHTMAGFAQGAEAHDVFCENLKYACAKAAPHGIGIVIEPLNHYDAPGYFLSTTSQAQKIITEVGAPNLKLMFDCYHVQLMEGDVTNRLTKLQSIIGHIQFASVPDRNTPDRGELSYDHIFAHLTSLGYDAPLGAEYKPNGPTPPTLGWLTKYKS
ncbi:hydroxypyruvate isomerase family protein [Nereida sp.]|uniref:hydroxypyruvate isomerase family protein n=1 Tax=Nereida sp. TaxID=2736090 RepID=UPI003F6A52FC